jgi:AcrR family transcriptional regulator
MPATAPRKPSAVKTTRRPRNPRQAGAAPAPAPAPAPVPARTPRAGGQATRQLILETAGQVFAERGLAEGTTKEIAERAGTPMASINYHFGSREGLYEAVLIEAHRQIVSVDELAALASEAANLNAEGKLRLLLGRMAGMAGAKAPWGYRVVVREVMAPSAQFPAMIEKAILPKAALAKALIASVLGLPPSHPAVQRAITFVVLPGIVLLVLPQTAREKVLPAVGQDPQALQDDLVRYVMGGLEAIAKAHRGEKAPAAKRSSARR